MHLQRVSFDSIPYQYFLSLAFNDYIKKVFLVIILIFSLPTQAQELGSANSLEEFQINSKYLAETRSIKVALPIGYKISNKTYPVIVVLDNQLIFSTITAISNQLSATSRMPESIIVTITENTRHRSYYAPNLYSNTNNRPYNYGNHQEELLQFLEKELLPEVDSKYRTVDFRTLVGFSPSAIFTLHTLWKSPGIFKAYIALAAGNIIGDGYKKGENMIDVISESQKKKTESKTFLYLVSGGKDVEGQPQIKSNVNNFNEKLSHIVSSNFKAKAEIIEGEGHTDVLLPGLISAFDFIFPKDKFYMNYMDFIKQDGNALKNILGNYDKLSEEYGFTIYPNMNRLYSMSCFKNIGNRLLGEKRTEEAIELYQYWTEVYPGSAMSHAYLGLALKVAEKYDASIKSYQKAVVLAEKNDLPDLKKYKSKLEELESLIKQK